MPLELLLLSGIFPYKALVGAKQLTSGAVSCYSYYNSTHFSLFQLIAEFIAFAILLTLLLGSFCSCCYCEIASIVMPNFTHGVGMSL